MENCCKNIKKREETELKSLLNRLNRIEGQIRGIKGMLENDAYCIDIINQAEAARSALGSFNKELLSSHIKSCVVADIKAGYDEKTTELIDVINKVMK